MQAATDHRINAGITRGPAVKVTINGRAVEAHEGETIGAVLTAAGYRRIRHAPQARDPRGLYCGMGVCHGCLVTVNGRPNVRACTTPVENGQTIVLQDGLGRFDPDAPPPAPARLDRRKVQVAVVGAGPAGLSAALTAARSGAEVLVVDDNPQPGGQIYRQPPDAFRIDRPAALGSDYADGRALLDRVRAMADRITVWNDAYVWSVFDAKTLAVARNDGLTLLDADAVVCATGAYERPVPVPGWTLPGVMTVGGAQLLIKSQRVRPGSRVLLAGTGPLQLVVANQMLDAGMKVVALAESAGQVFNWRYVFDLLHQPRLVRQGLRYLLRLKRAGVPVMRSWVLQSIEGDAEVERATLVQIDADGNALPSQTRTFAVDTVGIGYGLLSTTWLTHMLGCGHAYDPLLGGWVPSCDARMETDRTGVFVAGDGAGVAGVLVAKHQGAVAGLHAAAHAGAVAPDQAESGARTHGKQLRALYRFRRAMDRMYPVRPWLYANLPDETVVCRCEGVTAGEIRAAIREGTVNLNDIKRRTRMGMGYCQGANCVPTAAAILTREFGIAPEAIPPMTTRPPGRPVPMSLLMGQDA